ncbi:MAG TPA: succinate dehydrogenase, hydrophobic membrane anchor protein [Thiobacillaceae bacterium]|nr:succinate dehydrogenase, hydrophobic membrane anchor protein [Thiobacillaceae bacterium]
MRHVGGAHRGLDMWLLQRASAIYMAAFLVVFLILFLAAGAMDFQAWRGLFVPTAMKLGSLLFVAALLVHAWIGLREIFIDYVHFLVLRLGLYLAFGALYLGCLVWTVDILWSVK